MANEGDQLKDQILLYRNLLWAYQLEQYEDAVLKQTILPALDKARREIINELDRDWPYQREDERNNAILSELQNLTFGVQAQLSGDIAEAAAVASELSLAEHGKILSFNGAVADSAVGFNFVQLSAEQLLSLAVTTPVGGRLLEDWVGIAFEKHLIEDIKRDILAGMLKGESTKKLVDRIQDGFGGTRRDIISLVRTHVADANNRAAQAVYEANSDIVKEVEWSSTLEISTKSGFGVCPRCLSLDGRTWKLGEPHPPIPLHNRCRCFLLAKTISYKGLGLNIPELREAARPYTIRKPENIDAGRHKSILEVGQYRGIGAEFVKSKGDKYLLNVMGPGRKALYDAGKIDFEDLVDERGNLRLLKKNKDGEVVGLE